MNLSNRIKIAVAGCGYWGKNLIRNFHGLGVLTSVCDVNHAIAAGFANNLNITAQTFAEVLESDVDAVVIATPASQHFSMAELALKAGKHVFVEKPMSLTLYEANELCDLAKKCERILMVGHLMQYHPAFVELKEIARQGHLGRLQYIYSNRLNLGNFRNEENILWSFAPHDISMILALVGTLPEVVYASGSCYLSPRIHDVTNTQLKFANGVEGHIFVSWLHPYKEQKLIVVGDKGMAVLDDGLPWSEKLKIYPHQVNWINGIPQAEKAASRCIPLAEAEPLELECRHFLDSIIGNTQPVTNAEEGKRVLAVLDAAERSLLAKTRIKLVERQQSYFADSTAIIDEGCSVGAGTKIWHFSHVMKGSVIGRNCIIGQNVMIGPDVVLGDNCKIQNNVSLYKGVVADNGVFFGPSCVFTNVSNPRSTVERKDEFKSTHIEEGVTIGANATIICGNTLGAYSFIGAGAVVTKNVKAHAVVVGNPAKQIGWVSHAGEILGDSLICPREGRRYVIVENTLVEVTNNDVIISS